MGTFERPSRTTHIAVEALADCPFSVASEYTAEYLRAAQEHGVESVIRVAWHAPLPLLRHRVILTFGIVMDVTNDGRPRDEMRVDWTSGTPILPNFHGMIRFGIDASRTRVLIDGSYRPPLGAGGRLFDALAGRWIARASMQDLADRIARNLEVREGAWRATYARSTEVSAH